MKNNKGGLPVHQTLAFVQGTRNTNDAASYLVTEKQIGDSEAIIDVLGGVIYDLSQLATAVRQLDFPLYVGEVDNVLVDARRWRKSNDTISNKEPLDNLVIRGALEYYWNTDLGEFAGTVFDTSAVFGYWMADAIGGRFNMSEINKTHLKVYWTFYYWAMFKDREDLADLTKDTLQGMITRIGNRLFGLGSSISERIAENDACLDLITAIRSGTEVRLINAACEAMPKLFDTPIFKEFDYSSLIQLTVDKGWIGNDARILTAAMLEHPPTLMFMTMRSLERGNYSRARIYTAVMEAKNQRINVSNIGKLVVQLRSDLSEKSKDNSF